jgi:hypothetical protein
VFVAHQPDPSAEWWAGVVLGGALLVAYSAAGAAAGGNSVTLPASLSTITSLRHSRLGGALSEAPAALSSADGGRRRQAQARQAPRRGRSERRAGRTGAALR